MRSQRMRNFISVSIYGFMILGLGFPSITKSQNAPTYKDYAASIDREYAISPNGENISFFMGPNENVKLYIFSLLNNQAKEIPVGNAKLRRAKWGDDNHLLIDVSFFYLPDYAPKDSAFKYEIQRTISYNVSKDKATPILPKNELGLNTVLPVEYIDAKNKKLIVSAIETREKIYSLDGMSKKFEALSLFNADLDSGTGGKIESGDKDTREFFLDLNGNPRIKYDVDISQKVSKYSKYENKRWVEFASWNDISKVPYSIEGFLNQDDVLIFERIDGKNIPKILSLPSLKFSDYPNPPKDLIEKAIHDPITHEAIGFFEVGFENKIEWIDPKLKESQAMLDKAFAPKSVEMIGWNAAKSVFLVNIQSGNIAPQIFLFDTKTKNARLLGGAPPVFDNYIGPPKTLHTFKASDGTEIPVFVTKPDKIEKPMPAILLPHGGPQAKDDAQFDYISQFLASRGYVVIQPQYRGSTGLGEEFEDMGKGEWAGKMQSDTIEALDWAVSKNWVDKNGVCMVGFSYGGYSAMIGATKTPEKFKCIATYGGVYDLSDMREDLIDQKGEGENSVRLAYWREHIGYSKYSVEKIRDISPINFANNVKAPVLIMHGEDDSIVPSKQSEAMVKALKNAGKTVNYINIPAEDHWLSTDKGKEKFLMELEKFLAENLAKH